VPAWEERLSLASAVAPRTLAASREVRTRKPGPMHKEDHQARGLPIYLAEVQLSFISEEVFFFISKIKQLHLVKLFYQTFINTIKMIL
jgi:hypothetical protein